MSSDSFSYHALGLGFRSSIELPGLERSTESRSPRYEISICEELADVAGELPSSLHYCSETVAISETGNRFSIRYADGTKFDVDTETKTIEFAWDRGMFTLEDACTYLSGPVIGFVAGLEGFACFHGAAAVIDGGAVMVVGPSEAGKSTTAAAFALEGFEVLSDDVCATRLSGLQVFPAFPRVRLWPASVELLLGDPSALPLLTPNWDKRYLDLNAIERFAKRPATLKYVIVLDPSREPDSFDLESVAGAESVITLLGNSYPQNFRVATVEPLIFETATFIARHVPFRRIPAYLPPREIVRRVLSEVRS